MFAMCGVMSGNSRFHELHYVRDYLGWSSPGRLSASWIVDSKVEEMSFSDSHMRDNQGWPMWSLAITLP